MIDFYGTLGQPSDEKLIHYSREIFKVIDFLNERNLDFAIRQYLSGWQVIVPSGKKWDFDIICHDGSYGNKRGLLETMGCLVEDETDSVEGYLTGEEIIEKIRRLYLHEVN